MTTTEINENIELDSDFINFDAKKYLQNNNEISKNISNAIDSNKNIPKEIKTLPELFNNSNAEFIEYAILNIEPTIFTKIEKSKILN